MTRGDEGERWGRSILDGEIQGAFRRLPEAVAIGFLQFIIACRPGRTIQGTVGIQHAEGGTCERSHAGFAVARSRFVSKGAADFTRFAGLKHLSCVEGQLDTRNLEGGGKHERWKGVGCNELPVGVEEVKPQVVLAF